MPMKNDTTISRYGFAANMLKAWSMAPDHLQAFTARLKGCKLDEVPTNEPRSVVAYTRNKGMACFSISGILTRYPCDYDDYFGLTAVEPIIEGLRRADADASIVGIQLEIDSPGGHADAGAALAEALAVTSKRVTAIVDGLAASAAYRAASQADEIIATPSSLIGSIGTYTVLSDDTKFWADMGVTWHLISTGRFKGLGADGKVTQDLLDDVQREVNDLQERFRLDVTTGRGTRLKKTIEELADGRCWIGKQAMELGLIDEVGSRDSAMQAAIERSYQMNLEQFKSFAAEHPEAVKEIASPLVETARQETKASCTPKAATVNELEAAFPGQDSFIVAQLKAGATLDQSNAAAVKDLQAKLAAKPVVSPTGGQAPLPTAMDPSGGVSADRRRELLSKTPQGAAILRKEAAAA